MFAHDDRYEIQNGGAGWEDAERQIRAAQANGGKSTTVSVKSSKPVSKRKAGETVATVYEEEIGSKESKKMKKGGKKGQ